MEKSINSIQYIRYNLEKVKDHIMFFFFSHCLVLSHVFHYNKLRVEANIDKIYTVKNTFDRFCSLYIKKTLYKLVSRKNIYFLTDQTKNVYKK